jgi:hypothetical protein
MNKGFIIILVPAICAILALAQCKKGKKENRLADYVTNPHNGLSQKQQVDSNDILCQLIPEKNSGATGNLYRFMIVMKTRPGQISDSAYYFFNYRSAELFGLVENGDTLKPVLSERMANGRKDVHSFTVLFESQQNPAAGQTGSGPQLVFRKNELVPQDLKFEYQYKDINKALKTL